MSLNKSSPPERMCEDRTTSLFWFQKEMIVGGAKVCKNYTSQQFQLLGCHLFNQRFCQELPKRWILLPFDAVVVWGPPARKFSHYFAIFSPSFVRSIKTWHGSRLGGVFKILRCYKITQDFPSPARENQLAGSSKN